MFPWSIVYFFFVMGTALPSVSRCERPPYSPGPWRMSQPMSITAAAAASVVLISVAASRPVPCPRPRPRQRQRQPQRAPGCDPAHPVRLCRYRSSSTALWRPLGRAVKVLEGGGKWWERARFRRAASCRGGVMVVVVVVVMMMPVMPVMYTPTHLVEKNVEFVE